MEYSQKCKHSDHLAIIVKKYYLNLLMKWIGEVRTLYRVVCIGMNKLVLILVCVLLNPQGVSCTGPSPPRRPYPPWRWRSAPTFCWRPSVPLLGLPLTWATPPASSGGWWGSRTPTEASPPPRYTSQTPAVWNAALVQTLWLWLVSDHRSCVLHVQPGEAHFHWYRA